MSALLAAALGYAARGIPVYPVHWPNPTPGRASLGCSCPRGPACDRPAKHPLVRHGRNDATTHAGQLERWWSRWHQANLGLATGIVFDAMDVDAPPAWRPSASSPAPWACGSPVRWWPRGAVAGMPGFARPGWATAHPAAWPTWTGAAAAAPYSRPPSRHISGRSYRWLRDPDQAPLPEVPGALRVRLDPDRPTPARPAATAGPVAPGHRYGRRVLAAELAALHRATPGHRNHTLNRTAFKVYRYVAGGLLDDQEVTAAFTHAAPAIGLQPAEVARTLASARAAGLANPRTVPAGPGLATEEAGA